MDPRRVLYVLAVVLGLGPPQPEPLGLPVGYASGLASIDLRLGFTFAIAGGVK
jgi:hypothetical protein